MMRRSAESTNWISADSNFANLHWKMRVMRWRRQREQWQPLIRLECTHPDECVEWECETDVSLKIRCALPDGSGRFDGLRWAMPIFRRSRRVEELSCNLPADKCAQLFRIGGSIQVSVEIRIHSIKGVALSRDPLKDADIGDVVLVVGGNKLVSNRTLLAIHSPVFREMLTNCESDAEIVIDDVGCDEFAEIHNVILPNSAPITDQNLRCVQRLAERFNMIHAKSKIKQFLNNN
ncbi:unnamed protein product [Caenorhabditis bovis]|uniref:BTB domain-containing protein n=1 Tax=Caenorhabditis bovis TaxID=2654633 RepID=A0A8S1EKS3_9PELO|nr:unnamed protein product [Caenorhabditis bovis]